VRARAPFDVCRILWVSESKAAPRWACRHTPNSVFCCLLVSGLMLPEILLNSEALSCDPVIYVTRAMDEGDSSCLTCCEEANDVQIDQGDIVQVERDTL